MAKTIKFPLKLKDDFPVRSLDELRQYFDLNKIIGYFFDDKLIKWLEARDYIIELNAIKSLDKNDTDLNRKLCQIFNVEYSDKIAADIQSIARKNKYLEILRQYTSDKNILSNVDLIASHQEELGEFNDMDAMYHIGRIYLLSQSKEIKDYDKAMEWLQKAANLGSSNAMHLIADRYRVGDGISKDTEEAMSWYKKAAELGNVSAMSWIGLLYHTEFKDYKQSMQWFLKAIDNNPNDGFSMAIIGNMYEYGEGVSKNIEKAFDWYLKAAQTNNVTAVEALSYWYARHQNYDEAINCCQKMIDIKGDFANMFDLGAAFITGNKGFKDYDKAMQCFQIVAASDNRFTAPAIRCIGNMYRNGFGVSKDYDKAREWYQKAADLGDNYAIKSLKKLD